LEENFMIVYTSIYGEYDDPKPVLTHATVTDWILYTDSAKTFNLAEKAGWKAIFESRHESENPRIQAKWRKFHPPGAGGGAREELATSLYIDGSIRLRSNGLIDVALTALDANNWAMYCHNECDNLVDQITLCEAKPKYAYIIDKMKEQLAYYTEKEKELCPPNILNHPWAGGIIARRHTKAVLDASHDWWLECVKWTEQDQLSLPIVLARHGIKPITLTDGGSLYTNVHFACEFWNHKDELAPGRIAAPPVVAPQVAAETSTAYTIEHVSKPTKKLLSIITPLHEPGNKYIEETYESIRNQTVNKSRRTETERDWEWIVVENHGGRLPNSIRQDSRVRIVQSNLDKIGALKRYACEVADGDVVIELDNDDILTPSALEKIDAAFQPKGRRFSETVDFVYSDFAEFRDDNWGPNVYLSSYGWETYPVIYDDNGTKRTLLAMKAPPATAHNMRFVEWAPNHVRAWRAEAYWKAGGHNRDMAVGDDHELICRMYLSGATFKHIPECLYLYRVHAQNTVVTKNANIRAATEMNYIKFFYAMAEKWARDSGLKLVDLCGGVGCPPSYIPIDSELSDAHQAAGGIVCDLDQTWALKDSSVGLLRANDAIEHLKDPIHTMNEAWRVLAPGGFFLIDVPSTNGEGAWCDPTHVSFWNKRSFDYYTSKGKSAFLRDKFVGKFQVSRIIEKLPGPLNPDIDVPYVQAHLFCVKDGWKAMGQFLW
jgi:O-antigen biosynthesis protein